MTLSSVATIQDTIQRSTNRFSAVDTMGSLVGNREFKKGYCEFACGNTTSQSYIWQALSAASQSLGEEVYSNVLHYIDNVSNVDVCKVKSLMSMMKIVGIDYLVLDKISHYPIEIQKLIDILSINKRYLLDNAFIKQSFIDSLSADGVIQLSNVSLSDAVEAHNISSSLNRYVYDSTVFDNYLSSVFYDFLYGMLDMDVVPEDQMSAFVAQLRSTNATFSAMPYDDAIACCKAYKQILSTDGYGPGAIVNDKYWEQKKICNIDVSFDVPAEVDKIEIGQASLTDYSGDELSLIVAEIDYRRSEANALSGVPIVNLMARNAYYRKRKVIEYAKFIDNLVGLPTANSLSAAESMYQTYQYDPAYYVTSLSGIGQSYVLSTSTGVQNFFDACIVSSDVCKAARTLLAMVNYIVKIRETMRLQVRKVFMKGTNNLLQYAINEFIVDYANQLTNVLDASQVSSIVSKLSAHSVLSVDVQEYWDSTEYFNISAVTSNKYALNYRSVNDRYFDEVFSRDADGKLVPKETGIFTNDEISEFYLSTLCMKNALQYPVSSNEMLGSSGLSSNFYDFLSVMFDIAANPSYYDMEHNVFGSKLSDQVITHDIYDDLQLVQQTSAVIMSAAQKAGYSFDGQHTILEQKEDLFSKLNAVLQDQYLSAVSATYDQYSPQTQALSSQLDALAQQLSSYLNSQYAAYFCKSTNKYSYGEDGNYLFNYFVGNPYEDVYDTFTTYLGRASDWIQDNCYTYALSAALDNLSAKYLELTTSCDAISLSISEEYPDFVDMHFLNLAEELDSLKSFADTKISLRMQFLQNALDNFRSHASQLKSSYDQCEASFQNILASMPDTSQGYYFKWYESPSSITSTIDIDGSTVQNRWKCNDSPRIPEDHERHYLYDQYSQCVFGTYDTGCWEKVNFDPNNDVLETASLQTNVKRTINRIDECASIYYGFIGGANAPSTTTSRSYGAQKEALQAILMTISNIVSQLNQIISDVNQLFDVDSDFTELSVGGDNAGGSDVGKFENANYYNRILRVQSYLAISISDADFAKDAVMKKCNGFISSVSVTSAAYVPVQSNYESIWSDFSTFLQEYDKGGDFKVLKPDNLSKLASYRADKDKTALDKINASFSALQVSYQGIINSFVEMSNRGIELLASQYVSYAYEYTGKALESCLSDLVARLVKDVQVKTSIGNAKIDSEMSLVSEAFDTIADGERPSGKVGLYRKYFPEELVPLTASYIEYETAFNAQYMPFTSIMSQVFDKLNYTDDVSFAEQKLMFQNYTGITTQVLSADQMVAADPYYNYKNITHPSYQIHPFLWNFSEKSPVQQAIDVLSRVYANIDIDELEGSLVQSNLDKYIGQLGNVIDIWKNNTKDFTSYTTRYEQSDHVCRYTNEWSEVVDYDGAFYPPALADYLSGDGSYASVSKWYAHLSVEHDQEMLSRITSCLSTCQAVISSLTEDKLPEDVNDIFKYQVDTYGNMYILYKSYGKTNATYVEKLSSVGQMWIRLADSPIAFPLSSITNVSKSAKDRFQSISSIAVDLSSMDAWPICDFEILPCGNKICIAYRDTKTHLIKTYALDICYDMAVAAGVGDLWFSVGDAQSIPFPQSLCIHNVAQHYLGMYPKSVTEVDVAYIDANCTKDSDGYVQVTSVSDDPNVHIYQVYASMTSQLPNRIDAKIGISGIVGTSIPIAYYESQDKSGHLDIAFVTSSSAYDGWATRVEQPSLSVNLQNDTSGYIYADPEHTTMNSFDTFIQNVQVATVNFTYGAFSQVHQYQTNADIGYVPSYAGLSVSGPLSIADELNVSHQAIELLGKSTDASALTATSVGILDPYITMDDINDKFLYGRVWENGASAMSGTQYSYYLDKSLDIVPNMSFYQNMPILSTSDGFVTQQYVSSGPYFLQDLSLSSHYSQDAISQLRVIIYGTHALGQRIYAVGQLSSMQTGGEYVPVQYDDNISLSSPSVQLSGYRIEVAGTCNGIDESTDVFLNSIAGISSMSYSYDGSNLKLKYSLSSASRPMFIEPGTVKIALVNTYDVRFLEWFHIMDTSARYDGVPEPLNDVSIDKYIPTSSMIAVDLANYTAVSDVTADDINGASQQIFDTYNKMMFKVDESDLFPVSSVNYYVPSINTKYPLTFGQAYNMFCVPQGISTAGSLNVFKQDEVYVIDPQDVAEVSSVGSITFSVPYLDAYGDIRVYESYLSTDSDGILNSSKYCQDDPNFYQYAHFFGRALTSAEINVSKTYIDTTQVQPYYDYPDQATDKFSQFLSGHRLSAMTNEHSSSDKDATYVLNLNDVPRDDLSLLLAKASKLLRLYFNYKKTSQGIVLYVNYQNHACTPFVKVIDGKAYVDDISTSYAKVMPGTSEDVDVIVQFRQFFGSQLMSCTNITAATYRVYNISDDKPKFLLKKISGPSIQQQHRDDTIQIVAQAVVVPASSTISYSISMQSDIPVTSDVSCIIGVDPNAMSIDYASSTINRVSNSTFQAIFSNEQPMHVVKITRKSSAERNVQYPIDILDIQAATDRPIATHNGSVTFV